MVACRSYRKPDAATRIRVFGNCTIGYATVRDPHRGQWRQVQRPWLAFRPHDRLPIRPTTAVGTDPPAPVSNRL
jgi:hypothetical protein